MTLSTVIASLVGETAEGVRETSVAAARRRAALAEGLGAEPTATDVDAALGALFPPLHGPPVDLLARVLDDGALDEHLSTWRPGPTSVRAGGVYLHPDLGDTGAGTLPVAEFPPIERELGVSVLDTVQRGDGVARLTEKSVALVRRALRDRLEAERRTAAAAFADGVPTPVVESATVEAKAAFGGGEERIEATLLDGRRGAVPPELVGSVTTDLRFVPLPAATDGPDEGPEGAGAGRDSDGGDGDGGDGGEDDPVRPGRPGRVDLPRPHERFDPRDARRSFPGRAGETPPAGTGPTGGTPGREPPDEERR